MRKTSNRTILDQLPPGLTKTAPSARLKDRGAEHITGASLKVLGRDNITNGTWNTKTLRAAEKLQELIHEMGRYR